MHIIDKRGNIIYTAPKIGYTYFSDGLCHVLRESPNGGYKFGYIDTTGKLVIPFQFDDADFFQNGVARVKKGDKWGLINLQGKLIRPFYHDDMDDVPLIHDGIIRKWEDKAANGNSKWSYIDINGNIIIDTSNYSYISDFCNGYACVEKDGECALINSKGEIVIPFGKYSSIGDVYCGVAEVSKYGDNYKSSHGYVNTKGEEVVPLGKYDQFYWHDPELSIVCAIKGEDTCGYIDKSTGQEIIPCTYKYNPKSTLAAIGRGIYEDYYEISMFVIKLKDHVYTTHNEIYVYNTKLHEVYKLDDIDDIAYNYSEGLCAVEKEGKIGFIDETCNMVIPFKFQCPKDGIGISLVTFRKGVCAIGNMLIDKQGDIIQTFGDEYHHLKYEGDGIYSMSARSGVKISLINLKGEIIYQGYQADLNGPLPVEFPVAVIDKNVSYHNKWRFINKEGKSAFPYTFDEGYHYKNGFAVIEETISKGSRPKNSSSTSSHASDSQQLKNQIIRLVQQGNKLQAVKLYKEATGTDLKHAKDYVEQLHIPGTNTSNSGCYIATAVYSSYDCPEVWTLRRYRDYVLDESWYGRLFIRTYYAISPTLVKWFGATEWFRGLFRTPLNKWVERLNKQGFEDTPYNDKY